MGLNADEIVIIVVCILTGLGMAAAAIALALFRMRHRHTTLKHELMRFDNMERPMLDVVVGKVAADKYRRMVLERAAASGQPGWESAWYNAKRHTRGYSLRRMHEDVSAVTEDD